MVYNKKLCGPIKRQKSTIFRKIKALVIAHLIGDAAFEAVSSVCFAMPQRDNAGQNRTNLEIGFRSLVSPLCTLSTKLCLDSASQEMGILRETVVLKKAFN